MKVWVNGQKWWSKLLKGLLILALIKLINMTKKTAFSVIVKYSQKKVFIMEFSAINVLRSANDFWINHTVNKEMRLFFILSSI
jgi:hypothetical protein